MREFRAFMILIGTAALVLAGLGWLAWKLMALIEPDTARAWALVATVLLPAGAFVGYKLGQLGAEAEGRLKGIDDGLGKVVGAAYQAIDLRVQNITRTKEATREPAPYIVLPPPEPTFRMLEAPDRHELIELE
jgi:hypothetical protein